MSSLIQRLLTPPQFDDLEKTRRARLTHLVCMTMAVVATFYIGLSIIQLDYSYLKYALGMLVFCAAILSLNRYGYPRWAGGILGMGCWCLLAIIVPSGGADRFLFQTGYILPVLIIGFLVSDWAALLLAALDTSLGIVALAIQVMNGSIVLSGDMITQMWLQQTLYYLVGAVIVIMVKRNLNYALRQMTERSDQIGAQNETLQKEIAEREQLQEAYRALVDESLQGLYIIQDHKIMFSNRATQEIFGYTGEELSAMGNVNDILVYAEDIPMMVDIYQKRKRGELEALRYQARIIRKDGAIRWVENYSVNATFQGKLAARVVTIDITDRKEREQQERSLVRERERVELLTHLISDLSHDLKNPLSAIQTSLYLIERYNDPEKQKVKLNNIRDQTIQLDQLVRDMLTLSQLESNSTVTQERVELNRLLSEIVTRAHSSSDEKNLTLVLELGEDVPRLLGNENELNRAFTNLVDNAIQYTPQDGKITVRSVLQPGQVIVEVSDTGIGIDENDLPHLFDRFYRAKNARKVHEKGTGLGLAIVKRILENHGGQIEVETKIGQGSTFRAIVPVIGK